MTHFQLAHNHCNKLSFLIPCKKTTAPKQTSFHVLNMWISSNMLYLEKYIYNLDIIWFHQFFVVTYYSFFWRYNNTNYIIHLNTTLLFSCNGKNRHWCILFLYANQVLFILLFHHPLILCRCLCLLLCQCFHLLWASSFLIDLGLRGLSKWHISCKLLD